MSTVPPNESSNVFEFEFVPPKLPTKVESIFDFVNGDGKQPYKKIDSEIAKKLSGDDGTEIFAGFTELVELEQDDPHPLVTQDDDAPPPWSSEPEARLQAGESALDVAAVLDEIEHSAIEKTDELVLTESEVLDGYSPSDNGIIKAPVYFEFDHSASIDPTDENTNAEDAIAEAQAEAEYQRMLEKWEVESKNAELRWKKKQRDTEQEQVQIALEIQEITDNLKAARQLHKLAIKTLQDLKASGPDYPARPKRPTPPKKTTTTVSKDGSTTTTTVVEKKKPNADESWRAIKSETFISLKIEGLGKSKLDALLHQFPTLGDWVDAQVEASKKCKHFSTSLPKGIGEKLADRINDVVDDVFAKHCQPG